MDRLNIPHIPYTVMWSQGVPYSVCEDFINENIELIPAWCILNSSKRDNNTSVYQHFVNCCETLGIKDAVPFLDRMITLDYIIANEDRHFNNFGVLRNAETLEWIGMAPIYDSGSSLDMIKYQHRYEVDRKLFASHLKPSRRTTEIGFLFEWLNFRKLSDVKELITEVLLAEEAKDYMDENRIHGIAESVEYRVNRLQQMILTEKLSQSISTQDDVERDIAADYTQKM